MNAPRRGVIDSLVAMARRAPKGQPAVGTTPHTVAWAENKWRLLRFEPPPGTKHMMS